MKNWLLFGIVLSCVLCGCTKKYDITVDDYGLMHIDIMKDGIHTARDSEGNIIYKGEFKGGRHRGEHVFYYANNQISKRIFVDDDGKATFEDYAPDGQHILTQIVYPDSKYIMKFKAGYLAEVEKYSQSIKFGEAFSGEIFRYNAEGFLTKKIVVKDGSSIVVYDENEL